MIRFFKRHQLLFLYGISLAGLLFILRWIELRFLIYSHTYEVYAGAIALLFTALGIWLAMKLMKPKTVVVEKPVYVQHLNFVRNQKAVDEMELSSRELEVLELMAKGMSNAEIAEALFLSLNTVKTHSTNLFFKLEVKRRTQAVEKAKRAGIIA